MILRIVHLLLFAILLMVSAATSRADDLQAWIASRAARFSTVTPEAHDNVDLAALAKVVGDARVVALGTPVYGARELHQLQHRIVSYLVRELDFTAVALEAPLPETLDVNAWIADGAGAPASAQLSSLQYRFWQTEEMRATLEQLRVLDTVRLYGVDMLSPERAAQRVLDALVTIDPRRAAKVRRWLLPLADPMAEHGATRLADFARRLDGLERRLTVSPRPSTPRPATSLARRCARVLAQHVAYLRAFPDRHMPARSDAMTENVRWILEREGPTSRIILWMHAGHLATKPYANTGRQLRDALGDDYVVLGFTFGHGRFAGVDGSPARRGMMPLTVAPPPDGVLEGVLARAAARADTAAAVRPLLLDLRDLPTNGPVATFFGAAQAMRYIVGAYDEMRPEQGFHRITVPAYYDALVYVDRVTPTTPLP